MPALAQYRCGWSASVAWALTPAATLDEARQNPLTRETLMAQFGRLGNTPYELAGIELEVTGNPFAPSSLLNQVRRQAVEQAGGGVRE